MQIHTDDGLWHRIIELGDGTHLACGPLVDFRLHTGNRPTSLDPPLCPRCFSAFECLESARLARESDYEKKRREYAMGSRPIPTIEIPPKKPNKDR